MNREVASPRRRLPPDQALEAAALAPAPAPVAKRIAGAVAPRSRLSAAATAAFLIFFGTTCSSSDTPRHGIPAPGVQTTTASLPWTQRVATPAPRAETRPEHELRWLQPHRYDSSPEHTFAMAQRLINERQGWTMLSEKWGEDLLTARIEVVSPAYPWWDEVRVEVSRHGANDSEVRVTSHTVERRWDLGANRRRVIGFMDDLDHMLPELVEPAVPGPEWPAPKPALSVGVAAAQPLGPFVP